VIIIIGGGITGLSAAFELALRQTPFLLLEARPRAGGLIYTEHVDGFTIDAGADSLLAQKPAAIDLCGELGLGGRLMTTSPPRTAFVLKRGRLHGLPTPSVLGIPTTLPAIARYDLLPVHARARLALEPFVPVGSLPDESVAAFFRRRFGRQTVGLIAEPLLGGIHAGNVEDLSMRALFPRLVEAERQPGGVLRNLVPHPSTNESGAFRALREGMSELVSTLVARLPAGSIRLGVPVTSLARSDQDWTVTSDGTVHRATAIILAAPANVAARLLAPVDPTSAEICGRVPYVSTASVALGYRRRDVRHALAGSGFVVARQHNAMRITACTWVSSKWAHRAPDDHALLRAFLGGAHDPDVCDRTDAELVDIATRDLTPLLGLTSSPVIARVYRWREAGAQYVVGHRARMHELNGRLAALPGLHAAGSGFEAIGIPDCVAHGRRAAAAAWDYVTMRS